MQPCLDCGIYEYKNRRGLCSLCYKKRVYHGCELPPKTGTFEWQLDRARADKTDQECWPWQGSIDKQGYGLFNQRPAHRLVYEKLVRPLEDAEEPDHKCHTDDPLCFLGNNCPHRRCVNPNHIEPVQHSVNAARRHVRRIEVCINGHKMRGQNIYWSPSGRRSCRACRKDQAQRDYARKKAKAIEAPAAP